jgi:hypothetical protein
MDALATLERHEQSRPRHQGYVVHWNRQRRCGQVRGEVDGVREVLFFHISSVDQPDAVAQGVTVTFEVSPIHQPQHKHRRAVNVEVLG